jgi:hypothetical protein
MRSAFALLTWFAASLSLAIPFEPLAQFVSKSDDILLKLDYATYRGHYNSTNEVSIELSSCLIVLYAYRPSGLHLQEHPLRIASIGGLEMAEANSTTQNVGNSRSTGSNCLYPATI